MGMIFKNIEYMNGCVLKISAIRLYPKVDEDDHSTDMKSFHFLKK
jgi:hypothetical protein